MTLQKGNHHMTINFSDEYLAKREERIVTAVKSPENLYLFSNPF